MKIRQLAASTFVAAGLILATPLAADARPVIDEPRYCGPGYHPTTCEPIQTNDCVIWWQPWTWARTTCV